MDRTIIKEYLHHFFKEEELAAYLNIPVSEVKRVLNDKDIINKVLGPKGYGKIVTHTRHINKWLNTKDEEITIPDLNTKKIIDVANYMVLTKSSLGDTAKHFNIGKTTVYEYTEEKLPQISITLYKKVFDIKNNNMSLGTDYKKHQDEIDNEYALLNEGYTIDQISDKLGFNRNKIERDLSIRLSNLDKDKLDNAHKILLLNRTYGKKR